MLDAMYEKVELDNVIDESCQHLNSDKKKQLHALLSKYTKLFGGTLGLYPGNPMHIELEEGAQPVYRHCIISLMLIWPLLSRNWII